MRERIHKSICLSYTQQNFMIPFTFYQFYVLFPWILKLIVRKKSKFLIKFLEYCQLKKRFSHVSFTVHVIGTLHVFFKYFDPSNNEFEMDTETLQLFSETCEKVDLNWHQYKFFLKRGRELKAKYTSLRSSSSDLSCSIARLNF